MSQSEDLQKNPLQLSADFPAASRDSWEEAIRRDLKGSDYNKKLVWKTGEGFSVRPYYMPGDAPIRAPLLRSEADSWQLMLPGQEPTLTIDAISAHEEGAGVVQEVAFALAEASDLLAADADVETFGFAVGSNFFFEIAKLRAIRLLWARLAEAYGKPDAKIRIHVRTALENKALYDPYVNLLRVATEAMSAVIGGCDSLTIAPFHFEEHLAENVHHILREESRLARVMDPGAGSYYLEALTDEIARHAWTLFQEIEAAGGFAQYRESEAHRDALARSRHEKETAVARRRRTIVGVNSYPDIGERELDAADGIPKGWRPAELFEAIRLRTERHARIAGKTPRVLLLELGDLKMRKARSNFCLNLFGCAGFDIIQSETLQEADLIVLCSSDPEYLAFARDICPRTTAPIVVAGNPAEQTEALKEAGVADFVHILSNPIETLSEWQDRLGVNGRTA
jgi:methylmalonyl-CoA mutase